MELRLRLNVNRDIDAGGQIKLLQLIDSRSSWLDNVDQALVGAHFELVHRLLIDVDRAVHRELLDLGRKRHGAGNASAGALGGFDDVRSGLVDNAIIKAFKADTDTWCAHFVLVG